MSDLDRLVSNPPTATVPERRVLLDLDTDTVTLIAEELGKAASSLKDVDRAQAHELSFLARQLRQAVLTPEQADAAGHSREDPMHPANQLSRHFHTALIQMARYSGPACLVLNAVDTAAAIAADQDGQDGIREVVQVAHSKAISVQTTKYGDVGPCGEVPLPSADNPVKLRRQ